VTWRQLVAAGLAAGLDAEELRWIGEATSGREGIEWSSGLGDDAPSLGADRFEALVARRAAGEPLQYVLGSWAFRRLDLFVDRRVLIPRPETEWVVEHALRRLPPGPATVVDLGTGSGAIALAIADERWPEVRVVGTDASPDALAVARANLAGLGRRGTTVELREGDWYDALDETLRGAVDLVVSNPPYVAENEVLPASVADWEPVDALVSGPTGLEAVEVVVAGGPAWLAPGGWLVCEIGETQGDEAAALAVAAGLTDVAIEADLVGRDRILLGRHA
jgi:release factor glutamine methyltransferase